VVFCLGAGSERISVMIHKAITLKFVVPMVLVLALGISIGAIYLPDKHLVPVDYSGSGGILACQTLTGDFRAFTYCFPE
jgi:hypothetical protein